VGGSASDTNVEDKVLASSPIMEVREPEVLLHQSVRCEELQLIQGQRDSRMKDDEDLITV